MSDDWEEEEDGSIDLTKMSHTSDGKARPNDDAYAVTSDELRQFIERAEQLNAETADIAEQRKELFAEAKGRGYDTKAMRKIISIRKAKADALREEKAVLQIYGAALGIDEDLL